MNSIAHVILFLSSYVPLFIFFTILNTFGIFPGDIITGGIALIGIVGFTILLSRTGSSSPQNLKINSLQRRDGDFIAYIIAYIVPLLATPASSVNEKIVLVLLLALLCFLYTKSELFYINPLFSIMGYKLFQVTTEQKRLVVLITYKSFIQLPTNLCVYRLTNFVFLEKRHA